LGEERRGRHVEETKCSEKSNPPDVEAVFSFRRKITPISERIVWQKGTTTR
jgi:hypothetical protein